eukprot:3189044-Amphidinium_carterae.1
MCVGIVPGAGYDCKEWLQTGWAKLSNTQMVPSEYVQLHPSVRLVLPADALDAVLKVEGTDSDRLPDERTLGPKLFGQAAKQVVALEVKAVIKRSLEVLEKEPEITRTILTSRMAACTVDCKNITCIGQLAGKRSTQLLYRGIPFQVIVKSVEEEVNLRHRACLRGICASLGLAELLPGEMELCKGDGHKTSKVAEALYTPLMLARRHLQSLLADTDPATMNGATVMVMIERIAHLSREFNAQFYYKCLCMV